MKGHADGFMVAAGHVPAADLLENGRADTAVDVRRLRQSDSVINVRRTSRKVRRFCYAILF